MNWLDAVLIIPILWGAYQGYKKGLLYMVATIIGLLLGLFLAFKFNGLLSSWITEHTSSTSKWIPLASFIIILSGVIITLILMAKLLEQVLKAASLSVFNKVSGSVAGAVQYAFICSVLIYLLTSFEPHITILSPQAKDESFTYPYIRGFAAMINPALKNFQQEFENNVKADEAVTVKN